MNNNQKHKLQKQCQIFISYFIISSKITISKPQKGRATMKQKKSIRPFTINPPITVNTTHDAPNILKSRT